MQPLNENQLNKNPFLQFKNWFTEAELLKSFDPTVMALSTAFANGNTSVRIVLLKEFDETGFYFFTNYHGKKGQQLAENPKASLLFYWASMHRQIRIEGKVEKVSEQTSDGYFNSRPRESRIGAWASEQSKIIPNRTYLENRVSEFEEKYPDENIERPPHWGGFKLTPIWFEFWQEREFRLHDRFEYQLDGNNWNCNRLAP